MEFFKFQLMEYRFSLTVSRSTRGLRRRRDEIRVRFASFGRTFSSPRQSQTNELRAFAGVMKRNEGIRE
jgi:hypothetical protein